MKNRVFLLSTAAIALALPTFAMAQAQTPASGAPAASDDAGVVVVTGIRKSLMASQDTKKKSDYVVDAITAEDIGKFPNANVADALQQVPGIAISDANGEGQKITVRGLGPEFNTVLWNGRRIATDATDRSFNFDTISSDLLGGTEVYKTTNVALQTGGIGSTIDLNTLRPLDLRKPVAVFSARALYDKNSSTFTPEAFALFSRTFLDGRLGVLVAASYQRRDDINQYTTTAQWNPIDISSSQLNLFADGHGNGVGTYWFPAKLTNDVIKEQRERKGFNATVQYKFSDDLVLSVDGMYSAFAVRSDGIEKAWFGNTSTIQAGSITADKNNAVTRYSFINGPEFVKLNFDRAAVTTAFGANLKWTPNAFFASTLDISTSTARNNDGGHDSYFVIHGPDTILTYDDTGGYRTPIGIDGAIQGYDTTIFPAGSPQLAAAPPVGSNWDRNSLTGYRTWWTTREGAQTNDKITEVRWDNRFNFDKGWLASGRAGLAYSDQKKDLDTIYSDDVGWGNYGAMGIPVPSSLLYVDNMSNFLSSADTPTTNKFVNFNGDALINYLLSPAALTMRDQINNLPAGTSAASILPRGYTPMYQPGASYSVGEKSMSAYVELTLKGNLGAWPLTVIGGARYETTDEKATSAQMKLLDIQNAPGSGGTQYVSVFDTTLSPVTQASKYHYVLPSVNAKLELSNDLIVRGAISESLTRPDIGKLNPVITFPSTLRPSGLLASGGNGNLHPYTSWNYDTSVEWYYSRTSYLSLGYFYKKIDGLIVSSIVSVPVTIANSQNISDANIHGTTANFDLTQYINLGDNHVSGLEFAWQNTFKNLPGLLSNTGVTVSATIPWTSAKFDNTSFANNGAFPGLSNSYFLTAFYDDGALEARVSLSHRDKYFYGMVTSTEPGYTLASSQWDARLSYNVNANVQVFFDGFNITNTPVRTEGRYSSEFLNYQDTGARYDLGVRFKY